MPNNRTLFNRSYSGQLSKTDNKDISIGMNRCTNIDFLIDLCVNAEAHTNYKFLGGGRNVKIGEIYYKIPDNLARIIAHIGHDENNLCMKPMEFQEKLYTKLREIDLKKSSRFRSEWTEQLYMHPESLLGDLNQKVILSGPVNGNFIICEDIKAEQTYLDCCRDFEISIIKDRKTLQMGPCFGQNINNKMKQEEKIDIFDSKIRSFLGKNHCPLEENLKLIYSCHQGVFADIITQFIKDKGDDAYLFNEMLFGSTGSKSNVTSFKIDITNNQYHLFYKTHKVFSKNDLGTMFPYKNYKMNYESIFNDNYEFKNYIYRPEGFDITLFAQLYKNGQFSCLYNMIKSPSKPGIKVSR